MDLAASLERGYLPREMPPSFSTGSLAGVLKSLTAAVPTSPTNPTRFSIARVGGTRRSTEIPNPFSHFRVAELGSVNWIKLQRITAKSSVSLSRPVRSRKFRSLEGRATTGSARLQGTIGRMPGGCYTLRTDVSQFYPSVYTHAVDWAIRGKRVAKTNRRVRSVGTALDKALRDSRDQQTVGISIGPDTSWLVSELLLARVDEAMSSDESFGEWFSTHSYRFGDDMTVFTRTRDQAEEILSAYEVALAQYELTLNPLKVEIRDGVEMLDQPWVSQLRNARYRTDSDVNLSADVIELFSLAFSMSRENPEIGALSYAIKRCDPFPGGHQSWPIYRDCMLTSAVQEPSSIRHVYQVMAFAREKGLAVRDELTCQILNQICEQHAPLNHGFEVTWALTALRELGLPLDTPAAAHISQMDDNCSLLLLMDEAEKSKSLASKVNLTAAHKKASAEGALSSEDWLLAYESRARGWCPPRKWDGEQAWKELFDRNVRFLVSNHLPKPRLLRRRPTFIPSWGGS